MVGKWTIPMECYKCGESDKLMMSCDAPGMQYICFDCIEKEEKETGTVAIYSMATGVRFVSREKADELIGANHAR